MWAAGRVARWTGLVGLNYHRIGDGRQSIFDRGLWSATPEAFDEQLAWIKKNYDVVSPADLPAAKAGRRVIITFDDGYRDNYTAAFPALQRHGLPATFFVATGFIDHPRLPWWDEIAWMVRSSKLTSLTLPGFVPDPVPFDEPDREAAVRKVLRTFKALPVQRTPALLEAVAAGTGSGRYAGEGVSDLWMTWDMLRAMRDGGMTIGGHTVSHNVLSTMSADEQDAEITGCARRLQEELGAPMTTFSYPVGNPDSFDGHTRDALRRVGVKTAFTYYGGHNPAGSVDDYDLRRRAIEQDMTMRDFQAYVRAPWFTFS